MDLREWTSHHPYFVESAFLCLLGLGTCFLLPRHRRIILWGAALNLPYALMSWLHVPHFWKPEVTFFIGTSPEDFLWLGYSGSLAVFCALLPVRSIVEHRLIRREILLRYLRVNAVFATIFAVLFFLNGGFRAVMPVTLWSMALLGGWLFFRQPARWRLALAGAVGFGVVHWLDVSLFYALWPHTRSYWNAAVSLPWSLGGVPGYEVLWGLVFGAVWPLVVAVSCGLKIPRRGHPIPAAPPPQA